MISSPECNNIGNFTCITGYSLTSANPPCLNHYLTINLHRRSMQKEQFYYEVLGTDINMQIVHYINCPSSCSHNYFHRSPQEGSVVLLSCGMLWNRARGQLSNSPAAVCFSTAHHRATATITEFALRSSPCERGEESRGTEWVYSVCNE